MKLSLAALGAVAIVSIGSLGVSAFAADVSKDNTPSQNQESAEPDAAPFVVGDLPHEEPAPGFLGEPGAPSLDKQRELLAKSFLKKGLCDEDYFGKDYCAKLVKKLNPETPNDKNQAKALPDSEILGHVNSAEEPSYND